MAKKSSLRVRFNAPLTITIALASVLVFVLDAVAFKGKLIALAFTCHGSKASAVPFVFTSPVEYVRLVSHALGNDSAQKMLVNTLLLLALGPALEERYGTPMLSVMVAVTTLVAGVLNACLIPQGLTGLTAVVFMLLVLSLLSSFEKRELHLSWIAAFVLYAALAMLHGAQAFAAQTQLSQTAFVAFMQKNVATFVSCAAGICGSLFAFLVAPKKRGAKPAKKRKEPQKPSPMATPYDRPNPYDGTTADTQRPDEPTAIEEDVGTIPL